MDCTVAADSSFGPRVEPCRRQFDFTLTFENWILTLIPELCFILGGLVRGLWISRASPKPRESHLHHGLGRAKIVAASLVLALKTASLVAWALAGDAATSESIVASCVAVVSTVLLIPLSQYEHSRTVRPSSLICLYLLTTTVFEVAQVRTLWLLQPLNVLLAVIATASLSLRVLLLVIEVQEKGTYLTPAQEKVSPEFVSGILNRSVYWWINRLFFQGFRSDLTLQALYNLDENLTSKTVTSDLQRRWQGNATKHVQKHALLWHTFAGAKWTIIRAVLARALVIPLKYAQPFLFSDLIEHVSEPDKSDQDGNKYGLLGATFLVYTLLAATNATYKRQTIHMMTIMRGSLVGIIYAQTIQDKSASGTGAGGNALTHMSTDVDRIVTGMQNVHEMWAASIEIVIALVLLILRIGYPSVAALVVATGCIIGSSYIAPRMREKQRFWVQAVQERVNFTASILKVIRQVKMLGIERTVAEKIHRFRVLELDASKPFRLLIVAVNVLNEGATSIAPAATIIIYTATRLNLHTQIPRPDDIFTSLSLISLLTSSVTLLSLSLTKFTSGMGSFDRIQDYLLAGAIQDDILDASAYPSVESACETDTELTPLPGTELVRVQNGSFRYRKDGECQLSDLTFAVNRTEVVAITGPLGCGKSTLLKAVLGEIPCVGGQLSIQPSAVGYCQQVPYILNGTIRSNIVGDAHTNTVWLEKVLFACDLALDIDSLPAALETVVGTSGLQLSGGQKQRVALARAVYAKPELLVLDDIFSALDAITASRIFQRLFGSEGLIRQLDAGVIIVAVTAEQLRHADKVIILSENGRIDAQGSYAEVAEGCEFIQKLRLRRGRSEITEQEPASVGGTDTARSKVTNASPAAAQTNSRGSGDLSLYGYYIDSIGRLSFLCILGFAISYVVSLVFPQILLSWWSSSEPEKGVTYLVAYTVISVINVIAIGLYIGYVLDDSTMA